MLPVFAYPNGYSALALFAGKPRSNGGGVDLMPRSNRSGGCLVARVWAS